MYLYTLYIWQRAATRQVQFPEYFSVEVRVFRPHKDRQFWQTCTVFMNTIRFKSNVPRTVLLGHVGSRLNIPDYSKSYTCDESKLVEIVMG